MPSARARRLRTESTVAFQPQCLQKLYHPKINKFQMKSLHPLAALILLIASTSTQAASTILSSSMTVDNKFTAYISTNDSVAGTQIGSGSNWTVTSQFSTALTPGVTNYLHIFAEDEGGIAGFLGQFSLNDTGFTFPNGTQSQLTNTVDWKGSLTGFGSNYESSLTFLGTNGVNPWGSRSGIASTANWIWVGDAYDKNTAYFSLAITPTTSNVPDGGSTVALLGLAMTAVAGARRKFGA
jgi:hypothetical protein